MVFCSCNLSSEIECNGKKFVENLSVNSNNYFEISTSVASKILHERLKLTLIIML